MVTRARVCEISCRYIRTFTTIISFYPLHFKHYKSQGLHSPLSKYSPIGLHDKHLPSIPQVVQDESQGLVHVVKSEQAAHIVLSHANNIIRY